MRVLFLCPTTSDFPAWKATLAREAPGMDIVEKSDAVPPESIEAAVTYFPPAGLLKRFRNLKAIFSLGAGAEHLWGDPELPDVPLVRLTYPDKRRIMNEWVLYVVLHFHRGFDRYARLQREGKWTPTANHSPLASRTRVGLLGLGDLGASAALELHRMGFAVSGWSRRPKDLPGIQCFAGAEGLARMLPEVNILVGLLPLTAETEGLVNAELLSMLLRGAAFANAGRGGNVVTADLIAALDSGQLSGAYLDVTDPEPLPEGHALWKHPRVFISPHIASYPPPEATAMAFLEMMRHVEAGEWSKLPMVDRKAGY